jgi:hypothetical protein
MPQTLEKPASSVPISSPWNSPKDYPDADIEVLVYTGDEALWLATHADGTWRDSGNLEIITNVTHWQHLPEPPTA